MENYVSMEESISSQYAESSSSLVSTECRLRAGSVPNLGLLRSMAYKETAAYSKDSMAEDVQNSEKYLRLVHELKEGNKLLSIAKSHGLRVTDENEKLKFDHSKLQIEYKNLLFRHKEEEKKCKFRGELINDLQRGKEDIAVELEQLQIKCKSHGKAQEDDVLALALQAQSLQDLRINVELLHSKNYKLNKEVQLLTAKGKKDAEIIAKLKTKLHGTERKYKQTLAKLRNIEERHKDFSVVAKKLQKTRLQLDDALLEKDQYIRELEMLRSKIEVQTLEGLSHYKKGHKGDNDVIPISGLNCSPSPPFMSYDAQCHNHSGPSSILTLIQQNSECCSIDSERRDSHGDIRQSRTRITTGTNTPLGTASVSPQPPIARIHPTTNALSEYLYMTASALKIKFRDVHIAQDILARAGQSVPFWEAYDVMKRYIMEAETKQVVDEVNRYQEEMKKEVVKGEEKGWDGHEEDDYKIQNNVPIYHWSVITNPRSFFNRLSTEVADKLVPTAIIPTMNGLTPWGK